MARKSVRRSIIPQVLPEVSEEEEEERVSHRRSRRPSEKAVENAALDVSATLADIEQSERRKSSRARRSTRPKEGFIYEPIKKVEPEIEGVPLEDLYIGADDDNSDVEIENTKATTLFSDEDIDGGVLYGFRTPRKRPASCTATPKSVKKTANTKTPTHVRHQIKTKLTKMVQESESESDFSADDESDFKPDESEPDSPESEPESEPETPKKKKIILPKTPHGTRRSTRINKDLVPQSDNYFSTRTTTLTSNHTLDRLKNPRLPHDQLFRLLSEMKISDKHQAGIKELHKDYRRLFPKWILYLNEGFNILLYGLGSKKNLLEEFQRKFLKDKPTIVVNGFFPSVTIKDLVDMIMKDFLEITTIPANLHEAVDIVKDEMAKVSDSIFLLVHNIDGVMLRNDRAQSILSRLSAIPNIHLLASVDHINADLLWDNAKLANYKFLWFDVTTMLPYKCETAYENSLLVQNSGALALSAMRNVFLSLTSNGRGVFMIIIKSQINNKGNANYQGIAFRDLYAQCREAFLVSSDVALKAQLTEFLDHKMVKSKRSHDGSEYLSIPINQNLLAQFLDEHESK